MERILECCKTIFDRSNRPFGVAKVHLDEDGNPKDVTIEYLNAEMAATAYGEPEDLLGKNIYELWPDGDRTWLDYYYRAAYLGEAVEFETVTVEYQAFQNVAIFPIIEGYCCYELQDVTKWMTHTHPTMENVLAGLFFYEPRTGLMLLTDPAKECCGLNTIDLSARQFADELFWPKAAERIYKSITEYPFECEGTVLEERMRNGKWIRLSTSHIKETERFIVGFLEDITSLREAEAKSAKRYEIIESLSSEYYALHLIDLENDSITPYLLRNEAAEFFAKDVNSSASYSKWLEDYCNRYVIEEDRENVKEQLSRDLLLKYSEDEFKERFVTCRRTFNGEVQYIELRIIKLSAGKNNAVLAARNINQEVQNQIDQKTAMQNALTLAQHASEAKTTFLTNMSHDLRTPLNSIMGFSHLALSHLGDEAQIRNSLNKIIVSGEHLLSLINEILDVSRIESGKIDLNEQPLNFVQLIEDVGTLFSGQADEKNIELKVDASDIYHPDVMGDQLRIKQILVNTVGNAMKYTDAGGTVELAVTEGAVSPNGLAMFEISVRDTGCGMSKDFIDRVFMPFERDNSKTICEKEGTGLGMTIAKSLVDIIGGTISVQSEEGVGSKFDIVLPLKLDKTHQMKLPGLDICDIDSQAFAGLRALVVDDDELSREIIKSILSDRGFSVEEASNGAEALEAFSSSEEGYFNVIIMDMRMPKMTGDEAAHAMRALPREDASDIPIIAVTADAFEEGYRRSYEAGMTAHITKPLRSQKLIAVLREHLLRVS